MPLNVKNRTLFHGNNLEMLRGINDETVHLIATDPPFKKGRDFHATPDSLASGASFQDRWSWKNDVHQDWVDQLEDDWPDVMYVIQGSRKSYGDDMGAFLCFMGVRLLEMKRVLRQDGSIYLHCDPTASHYLKELMDAIFGKQNFRNEIAWCYTGPSNTKRWFPRKHDTILYYVKANGIFNHNAVRVPYDDETIARRGRIEGKKSLISSSVETDGKRSSKQVSAKFGDGKVPEDWWCDIAPLTNQREKTGYPTQKPLALYGRIIEASSNKGDVVLDPFCGCATTLIAAENLKRKWIGIDIWDKAHKVVMERLKEECHLAGPDGKRDDLIYVEGKITYTDTPPTRTDNGGMAVPLLKTIKRLHEPPGQKMSREDMLKYLLEQYGCVCRGCDKTFDDPRHLELDHNSPRADGGLNHITNRVLLCGPCNKTKSNMLTLSGLRRKNKKMEKSILRYMKTHPHASRSQAILDVMADAKIASN